MSSDVLLMEEVPSGFYKRRFFPGGCCLGTVAIRRMLHVVSINIQIRASLTEIHHCEILQILVKQLSPK